jgi:hypothetical protein
MSEVAPTPATDGLIALFRVLRPEEQEAVLRDCQAIWLQSLESTDTRAARIIASLNRVAEVMGETPGVEDYKRVRAELIKDGAVGLVPSSQILRHFGSWHLAREAVDLTQVSSVRKVEERFRKRRLNRVWRYTEDTLRETLRRAVEDLGRVPQVAEFEFWREREIELARARGELLHLPSPGAYRRRYGNWEKALSHFDYTSDERAERLERLGQE